MFLLMNHQTFHKYNRLVKRGVVAPLVCAHCQREYTLRADEEGNTMLQCFFCDSLVYPGLNLYSQVAGVVAEFYN